MIHIPIILPSSLFATPLLTLIPVMTSNTTPYGIASANVNTSTAFNAFNSTGWDAAGSSGINVTYQFVLKHTIRFYYISISGASNLTWQNISGSNDGITWTIISTINPFLNFPAQVTNAAPYSYYRVNFGTAGAATISGLKIQLTGY